MNIIPMFVTGAEVMTFRAGGDMAIIKFYYQEPSVPRDYVKVNQGMPNFIPAVTVMLPRVAAKEMIKSMSYFFAKQDEHSSPMMVCRTCKIEECPMKDDMVMDPDKDGCSKWVGEK